MSIDLDDIENRIATGIYGDDRMSKEERNDSFSALAEIIAEVSDLRQTLDATEKERDQWLDAALDRRQAVHDADALRTGVHLALNPEGGVNGWRPSRGVDALIDLALTVREDAEDAEKGARACDQIVALLDGIPVEAPCPEAARVAALLAEASFLRACVPPVHPGDYGHEAWAEAVRAAVAEERAAVVAWLRGDAGFRMVPGNMAYCDYYADAIERGEHRHEEE